MTRGRPERLARGHGARPVGARAGVRAARWSHVGRPGVGGRSRSTPRFGATRPRRRQRRSGSCCATARRRSARCSGLLRAGACVVTVNPLLGAERLRPTSLGARPPAPARRARRPRAAAGRPTLPRPRAATLGALGEPIAVAMPPGCATPSPRPGPGVAVRMLTSGTTGPPKRIDLGYEMLELVMRGAKHYETGRRHRRPPPRRRRHRQRAARPRERRVPRGAGGARRPPHRAARALHRRRLGRRGAAAPAQDREPRAHRAAHGARRRRRRRRVHEHPFGRLGHRAARSRPRRRVHRSRTACRCSRRTAPPSSAAASRAGTSPTIEQFGTAKRGSVGRAHAGCALRDRRPRRRHRRSAPTTSGCSRSAPSQLGTDDWVRTTDLARLDADGFLWIVGRADQTILRGGYKVQPEVVRAALERDPAVAEASGRRASSDERLGAVPVAAVERRPGARARRGLAARASRARTSRRYEVPVAIVGGRRAAPHRVGQGRSRRGARAVRRRVHGARRRA